MSHSSYEKITYGKMSYLAWNSKPDDERYFGVRIQRALPGNNNWETVAEYPRSNDPGRFEMLPGQIYRVISLWNLNHKFFSTSYPTGVNLPGRISEVIEEGVFSANINQESGTSTITIEERVEVSMIGARVVAPTTTNFDLFIPALLVNVINDTSFSPAPGAILTNPQFTDLDVYLPILSTLSNVESTIYSLTPGGIIVDGVLTLERTDSGTVINIG